MRKHPNPITKHAKTIPTTAKIAVPGVADAYREMKQLSFADLIDIAYDEVREDRTRQIEER